MIYDVVYHALFGVVFGITGAAARNQLCKHWYHQALVGGVAILIEAYVMVAVVG